MKALSLILILALCAACNEESGGNATPGTDSPNLVAPTPAPTPGQGVQVTVKSGVGPNYAGYGSQSPWSCFIFAGDLYCKGDRLWPSNAYLRVVAGEDPVTDLHVWNSVACYQIWVEFRPYTHTAGHATFCVGEQYLNGQYSQYPVSFSYQSPANDSPRDHRWLVQPFMGAELTLAQVLSYDLVPAPSTGVTETTESCNIDQGILTCAAFSVDTN